MNFKKLQLQLKQAKQKHLIFFEYTFKKSSPLKEYSHALEWKNVISNPMFIFQTKKEVTSPFYSNVFNVV